MAMNAIYKFTRSYSSSNADLFTVMRISGHYSTLCYVLCYRTFPNISPIICKVDLCLLVSKSSCSSTTRVFTWSLHSHTQVWPSQLQISMALIQRYLSLLILSYNSVHLTMSSNVHVLSSHASSHNHNSLPNFITGLTNILYGLIEA
jgi:hypothetical protein